MYLVLQFSAINICLAFSNTLLVTSEVDKYIVIVHEYVTFTQISLECFLDQLCFCRNYILQVPGADFSFGSFNNTKNQRLIYVQSGSKVYSPYNFQLECNIILWILFLFVCERADGSITWADRLSRSNRISLCNHAGKTCQVGSTNPSTVITRQLICWGSTEFSGS